MVLVKAYFVSITIIPTIRTAPGSRELKAAYEAIMLLLVNCSFDGDWGSAPSLLRLFLPISFRVVKLSDTSKNNGPKVA